MKSAILILSLSCLVFIKVAYSKRLTEEELQATVKMVRNTCQSKTNATAEQIDGMHKGDWNQDKNEQCYMWCYFDMYKFLTKDNHFDWEITVATYTELAPDSIRSNAIASIKNCKDAVKTFDDKCAAGFEIARCIYLDNPEHYFLH